MSIFTETLRQKMKTANLACTDEDARLCEQYYKLVVEANKRVNLTRITSEEQAAQMHFFGAIELLKFLDIAQGARVIDIGTGAGFPGVPLKIVRGDIDMTLMDAAGKKTEFVKSATAQIGLDVTVLTARAEEADEQREMFDVAVSRAVANMPMLTELCVPFVKVGGFFVAWKGEKYSQDLSDAQNAISTLGCEVYAVHELEQGAIIVLQKNKPTPEEFPRRFAKIKSEPL